MDTENIIIFDTDLEIAQALCSTISDSDIRNRAVANIVGAKIASRFFEENYTVDSESGLHNIPNFLEKYDISDIYVENSYIDVRVYFNEDELCVPKQHFDDGVFPVAYMFVKIKTDLSGGVVTGFIKPENLDKNYLVQGYYHISEDSLGSFYDIEPLLTTVLDTFELPNELAYKCIEGSLEADAQTGVLKGLVKSKSSRIKLAKIAMAQSVLNSVKLTDFNDNLTEEVTSYNSDSPEDNLEDSFVPEVEVESEEEFLEALDYTTEVTPSNANLIDEPLEMTEEKASGQNQESEQQEENLDALFTGEQEGLSVTKKKKTSSLLVSLLLILLITGGFFAYNHFTTTFGKLAQSQLPGISDDVQTEMVEPVTQAQGDAMPVETVETVPAASAAKEEALSVAIPAIEKHLDASVLVSNLRVEWEIPSNYTNNASAKRYLYKLGKIIQLNLRSELLLLSKPPLSNKITVELKYNPNVGKFEYIGIKDSSGERTVDSTIEDTVKDTLNMNMSMSTETFDKLQGNPILIIRL